MRISHSFPWNKHAELKGLCHAIYYPFKKLNRVLASVEFQNNGPVLVKTIWYHTGRNC